MSGMPHRPGSVTAAPAPSGAFTDLRGFRWALAPLQTRLEWELGASKERLAKALAELTAARAALASLLDDAHGQAQRAGLAMGESIDPVARRLALSFLVQLGSQVDAARARCAGAEGGVGGARADSVQRQQRLDTLLAARNKALHAHVRTTLRRKANEADAAWLARCGAVGRVALGLPLKQAMSADPGAAAGVEL
ncbi:MAG TPA: hypothetical protein VLJ86_25075 [Ramlibacter sp.]|nr:hypothetical protein [Ramlibacter sp.]